MRVKTLLLGVFSRSVLRRLLGDTLLDDPGLVPGVFPACALDGVTRCRSIGACPRYSLRNRRCQGIRIGQVHVNPDPILCRLVELCRPGLLDRAQGNHRGWL